MNPFDSVRYLITQTLQMLQSEGILSSDLSLPPFTVEPPRDPSHGCMASNVAMVLAKPAGMQPRQLATSIASHLSSAPDVSKIVVAGPGFINFFMTTEFWSRVVHAAIHAKREFGRVDTGAGRRILVEYVSANPTGRLHVGHIRGAVAGDVLANLLEHAGYEVLREYYVNDSGNQAEIFTASAELRMREAMGEIIGTIPPGHYPGQDVKELGSSLATSVGKEIMALPEADRRERLRTLAIKAMLEGIRSDMKAIGIDIDNFVFETKDIYEAGRLQSALDQLEKKGLTYYGRLARPIGHEPPQAKPSAEPDGGEEILLFRSTSIAEYGDQQDQALVRADGRPTYFAGDLAYHQYKFDRGFEQCINVWGAEHTGHIARVKAALHALSEGQCKLEVVVCQTVRIVRNGKPEPMSKRRGNALSLQRLVDEVGSDAIRFDMMRRSLDAPLDFDLALAVEQTRANPVFYVQYAYARICSVLRRAEGEIAPDGYQLNHQTRADLTLLRHPLEIALMKSIGNFPRILSQCVRELEPHRLAYYLSEDLSEALHTLWNRGKEQSELRFLPLENPDLCRSRLALLTAAQTVLANGMELLGVSTPERMG